MAPSLRPTDDPNLQRIQANVATMRAQGAPEADVLAYLQHEDSLAGAAPSLASAIVAHEGAPGRLRSFLYGTALGSIPGADRVAAAASSVMTGHPGKYYQANLEAIRALRDSAHANHPGAAIAGTVTGAAISPMYRGLPFAQGGGATIPAMIGRGAAGGAIAGAVTAGAEGDGTPMERALRAAAGAVAGGIGGGVLGPLAARAPRIAGTVAGAGLGAAANPDHPLAGAAGGAVAGATGATLLQRALAARAGGQVASANPILPPSDATASAPKVTAAERTLLRWLGRSGVTPEAMLSDVATRPAEQPVTIMELGGEPVQRLARAARGVSPNAGKNIGEQLVERARGGFQRTLGVLEKHLGVQRGSFLDAVDDIVTRRNEMANPLYEQAFSAPPIPAEKFGKLLERPSIKQALAFAQKIAAERGGEAPAINADGSVPVKTVDLIKKSLDDVLGFAKTRGTLPDGTAATKETLRAINDTRRELLAVADDAVKAYGQARQVFAGHAALSDALESGRAEFLSSTPGEVARATKGLSQGEREMYLKGALEAVAEKLGGRPRASDFVKAIRDNNEFEPRFRALLPDDDAFKAFVRELEQEGQFPESMRVVTGGSNTADKAADQELLGLDAAQAIRDVGSGSIKTAVVRRLLDAAGNRMRLQTAAQADALAAPLTAGIRNRAELARVLARLTEVQRITERQATRGGHAAGVGSGVFARSLFRPAP